VQTDFAQPAAVLSPSGNVDHGVGPELPFDDEDVLGMQVTADPAFEHGGYFLQVVAGAYFETE